MMNALHARIVRQRLQLAVRHLGDARLQNAEATAGLAAVALHEVHAIGLVVELDDDVRLAGALVFHGVVEMLIQLGVATGLPRFAGEALHFRGGQLLAGFLRCGLDGGSLQHQCGNKREEDRASPHGLFGVTS